MSETRKGPAKSPEIERPTCKECGSRMWLRSIAPAGDSAEYRTFECPVCEVSTDRR